MKKIVLCLLTLPIFYLQSSAQTFTRYIIQFKNKAGTPYAINNPITYLSQRAIDRRTRYTIAVDSTDLPVTPAYVDSIRLSGAVTILNTSRWLNQVSIQTSDGLALSKIGTFPFVKSVSAMAARATGTSTGKPEIITSMQRTADASNAANATADYFNYGLSFNQIHIHNGEFLHNVGLRGQGMILSILDGGFFNYTSLRSFDSVNAGGQVLGTYDFVAREQSVTEDDAHGMQCFSIIAANIPGQFVGTAPKASFYLFRSEDSGSEFPIEEHNWVCAAERVDSAGGDVISSSLGYSDGMTDPSFNHTYAQMNGNTTIAANGADLAAKKGILVVNAIGNDGTGSFHFLSTPSDGDSVMAVGAVNTGGAVASFSSFGPSSDGQVKPDVASVGVSTVLQTPSNTIGSGNGTSFATPNIAGLATCLWQGFQEFNNIKILNALRQSGSKATAPDTRVGYGIPDMKKATLQLLKDFSTASVTAGNCKNTVSFTSKDVAGMKYEIERKLAMETSFTKIGETAGTGSAFSSHTYSFADSLINVQAGLITYRIRQIIDTAAATFTGDYIDTVSLTLASSCVTTAINPVVVSADQIILLPNPAHDKVTVQITTVSPVQQLIFEIVNVKGQVVFSMKQSKPAGTSTFDLPLYNLAKGKYFVNVYNNIIKLATKKLIKL